MSNFLRWWFPKSPAADSRRLRRLVDTDADLLEDIVYQLRDLVVLDDMVAMHNGALCSAAILDLKVDGFLFIAMQAQGDGDSLMLKSSVRRDDFGLKLFEGRYLDDRLLSLRLSVVQLLIGIIPYVAVADPA